MSGTTNIPDARLFDLVWYMRSELLEDGLITEEEYGWLLHGCQLAQGNSSPSPRRLESYDEIRRHTDRQARVLKEIAAQALPTEMDDHTAEHADYEGAYTTLVLSARLAINPTSTATETK